MRGRWSGRLAAAVVLGCVLATTGCGPDGATSGAATSSAPSSSARSSSAGSSSAAPASGGSYLALGDSVPFGYRDGGRFADEASLVGYPSLVGRDRGLRVINATCPGETTASFLDISAPSNGCERTLTSPTGYRAAYPLHVRYASPQQTQLDFAVQTLRQTPDVRLVTVQIGANDGFLCEQTTPDHCAAPAEQLALAGQVQTNLTRILTALRDQGGYRGRIVVVTYYAIVYSPPTLAATQGLDGVLTQAAKAQGAVVADGLATFRPEAEAAGGSAIKAGLVGVRDVHPTAQGQVLLSRAVEAVAP